jgi:hypothetical protein
LLDFGYASLLVLSLLAFFCFPSLTLGLFFRNAFRVLCTSFVLVERDDGRVGSAHAEVASGAAEDWTFYAGVMELARCTARCEAVKEVFVGTQEAAHGKLVETKELLVSVN